MGTAVMSVTRKIGSNRGKPRLWLEGAVVFAAGLTRGTAWQLMPCHGGFDIVATDDGSRHVAGTADRPILDISGCSVCGLTGTVAVTAYSGRIEVRQ